MPQSAAARMMFMKKVQKGSAVGKKAGKQKPKLGSGKRFSNLKKSLAKKGAKNPGALAAAIGRKKYGAKRFAKLGAKGKK